MNFHMTFICLLVGGVLTVPNEYSSKNLSNKRKEKITKDLVLVLKNRKINSLDGWPKRM